MSSPNLPSSPSGSSQPPASFLFTVRELVADGESEQQYYNSQWFPPTEARQIEAGQPRTVYCWNDGLISKDDRYLSCISDLTAYKTNSVFWCNKRTGFVTAPGDASFQDVKSNEPPLNRWRELQFYRDDYDRGLSRLTDAGESYLFGTGPKWIENLGLDSYDDRCDDPSEDVPKASGLGGELPMVIAILAFSCKESKLEKVLISEKAWKRGRWRGHKERSGRIKERGLVVNIYLDPGNSGSTKAALQHLESGYGSILVR